MALVNADEHKDVEVIDWESDDELEETMSLHSSHSSQAESDEESSLSNLSSDGQDLEYYLGTTTMDMESHAYHREQVYQDQLKVQRENLWMKLTEGCQDFAHRQEEIRELKTSNATLREEIQDLHNAHHVGNVQARQRQLLAEATAENEDDDDNLTEAELVHQIRNLLTYNKQKKDEHRMLKETLGVQMLALQQVNQLVTPPCMGSASICHDLDSLLSEALVVEKDSSMLDSSQFAEVLQVMDEPEVMEWCIDNDLEALLKHNELLQMQAKVGNLTLANNVSAYRKLNHSGLLTEADFSMALSGLHQRVAREQVSACANFADPEPSARATEYLEYLESFAAIPANKMTKNETGIDSGNDSEASTTTGFPSEMRTSLGSSLDVSSIPHLSPAIYQSKMGGAKESLRLSFLC